MRKSFRMNSDEDNFTIHGHNLFILTKKMGTKERKKERRKERKKELYSMIQYSTHFCVVEVATLCLNIRKSFLPACSNVVLKV